MDDKEIYSATLTKGKRTYFFDIKKTVKGKFYLKVVESKKTATGFERNNILVFEEDVTDFAETLSEVLTKLEELKEPKQTDSKAYSVEKIRQTHKQAYQPWTKADDNKLELLYCEGQKVKDLAKTFGRNEGAISSRIKKLEMREKYDK